MTIPAIAPELKPPPPLLVDEEDEVAADALEPEVLVAGDSVYLICMAYALIPSRPDFATAVCNAVLPPSRFVTGKVVVALKTDSHPSVRSKRSVIWVVPVK